MIPLNKKLLYQNKIVKRCRKITACVNARLIALWESYPDKISCKKLLKELAEVYSKNNEFNDAFNFDDDKDDLSDTDE